ncbi:uncharacterized protein LOC111026678 [Myzus persicae]|uniref:uncharacterized protein LOC111026678 n=1 Tax=Myzus persicae TaxID=13164 RepID=UPI000B92F8C6|nr:uncharacterized protein LOC111026678 [Myzus persicae]
MSPESFTESEVYLISPPRYSSMSPMDENLSPAGVADEDRGIDEFLTQINLTQATWVPIRKTKSLPIDDPGSLSTTVMDTLPASFDSDNFAQDPCGRIKSYRYIEPSPASPAVDETDGMMSFNHSPSILDFTSGKPTKKLKPNPKRKLFD